MTEDPKGSMNNDDPNAAMGMVNGEVKTLTQAEYEQAVIERDADEEVAAEDDTTESEEDDLSDLDELEELIDAGQ